MMIRLFVDTSVLFAAALSPTGAARELLCMALRGHAQIVISQDVLDEAERNLTRKAPETLRAYRQLILLLGVEIVNPTANDVRAAEGYVVSKDAPIVAAARAAKVDFLVTFDRKHLLDPPEIAARAGLRVVLPQIALDAIRKGLAKGATGEEDGFLP